MACLAHQNASRSDVNYHHWCYKYRWEYLQHFVTSNKERRKFKVTFTLCAATLLNCVPVTWIAKLHFTAGRQEGAEHSLPSEELWGVAFTGAVFFCLCYSAKHIFRYNRACFCFCDQYWIWGTKMKCLFPFLPSKPAFLVDGMRGLQTGKVVHPIYHYKA